MVVQMTLAVGQFEASNELARAANILQRPYKITLLYSRETQVSGNIMFSSATQPSRHNFVVSAITFEGFKLHSSNLTHALLVQISRTSLIIDIIVPSKMAAGDHYVKQITKKSCVSIWNGQKCDRKLFSDIQNGHRRPFCQIWNK